MLERRESVTWYQHFTRILNITFFILLDFWKKISTFIFLFLTKTKRLKIVFIWLKILLLILNEPNFSLLVLTLSTNKNMVSNKTIA